MRQKCSDEIEEKLTPASSMKDGRNCNLADKDPEIITEVLTSIAPVKELMNEIFHRLNLKGSFFKTFDAATDDELAELFSEMKKIDATVDISDTSQEKVRNKTDLLNFLKTHCAQKKYMFSVKKCDNVSCTICLPPRLPNSIFSTLYHLPDPISQGGEGQKITCYLQIGWPFYFH